MLMRVKAEVGAKWLVCYRQRVADCRAQHDSKKLAVWVVDRLGRDFTSLDVSEIVFSFIGEMVC